MLHEQLPIPDPPADAQPDPLPKEIPKRELPGASYDPGTGERFKPDCQGPPGLCLFFRCKWNLVLDVLSTGTIKVHGWRGMPSVTLPVKRSKKHTTTYERDVEEAGEAAARVAEWLEAELGTTCMGDIIRPHTQQQVARALRVERQRIQQIERGVARNPELAELAQHASDARARQSEQTWPEPGERLYTIRKSNRGQNH